MKPFISHDGTDSNGVRAEVHVSVNRGIIDRINDGDKGTSDVYFKVEGLKFPVHGWVGTEDAVYAVAKAALESKELVDFRIESQRKKKVDRTLPIAELRASTEAARENTVPILAGINGLLSQEALTNPKEDPSPNPSGRLPATDEDIAGNSKKSAGTVAVNSDEVLATLTKIANDNSIPESIVSSVAAQALLAGVSVEDVQTALAGTIKSDTSKPEVQRSFTVESQPWKDYNSDGHLNLGSLKIQAGIGAESFIRGQVATIVNPQLLTDPSVNDAVEYFAGLSLSIADRVQTLAYGAGFKADRGASSHARVRGIVYDTIERYYNLPLTEDLILPDDVKELDAWVGKVGKLSIERFRIAIRQSTEVTPLAGSNPPASLLSDSAVAKQSKEVDEVEVNLDEAAPTTAPIDLVVEEPVVAEQVVTSEEEVEVSEEDTDEEYVEIFPPTFIDENLLGSDGKILSASAPSNETVENLKDFVKDAEILKEDLPKVSKLLAYTFGPKFNKATNIPDDDLVDFIDFYVASGSDNFLKVLNKVAG